MKSLNEFYELLENFTTGVVIHDSSTAVQYANLAALDFLGLTIEQIQGKKVTRELRHHIGTQGDRIAVRHIAAHRDALN